MSSVNRADGLVPVGHRSGGVVRYSTARWTIATAYTTAIYNGDLVSVNSTNKNNLEKGTPSGDDFVGVFAGVQYTASDGEVVFKKYWDGVSASRTNIKAYVYDDPDILFRVGGDEAGTAAGIGSTADIVASTTGSTLTGKSNMTLDVSNIGTGVNLQIVDVWPAADNAVTDAYPQYVVYINEHRLNVAG